jgi:hypothetical protein
VLVFSGISKLVKKMSEEKAKSQSPRPQPRPRPAETGPESSQPHQPAGSFDDAETPASRPAASAGPRPAVQPVARPSVPQVPVARPSAVQPSPRMTTKRATQPALVVSQPVQSPPRPTVRPGVGHKAPRRPQQPGAHEGMSRATAPSPASPAPGTALPTSGEFLRKQLQSPMLARNAFLMMEILSPPKSMRQGPESWEL